MTQGEYLEERADHRRIVMRMAALNAPCALLAASFFALSLVSFLDGAVGAILPMTILGVIAIAFASEATAAVRDLRTPAPVTMTGEVRRTWSRGGLMWFFRSHYMYVDKTVFTVSPVTSLSVQPGDTVEVEHWPHTKTVIRIRLVKQERRTRPVTDSARQLPWRG